MRRLLGMLLLSVALVASWEVRVGAHGGDLAAIVSLQPRPDQTAALSFSVQDVYGVKVQGARVKASLRGDGAQPPPLAAGTESGSGEYRLTLPLPQAEVAILRLEVTILTDEYAAEFPVAVGSEVSEIGVTLLHRSAPAAAKSGTFTPGALPTDPAQIFAILSVIGVPVVLAVLMQRRRRPLRK